MAGGPRQDSVLFLSCSEEQKLRFQGKDHSAALRGPVRLGGKSWLDLFLPASGSIPVPHVWVERHPALWLVRPPRQAALPPSAGGLGTLEIAARISSPWHVSP